MDLTRQNPGQAKSSPRKKRSGGGNPQYKLAQGVQRSRDGSPSRSVSPFVPPAPHYPTQAPSSTQLPPPPPLATQRVGLLPHPVFPPPPAALLMSGGLPLPTQFPQGPPPPLPQPGELGGMTSLTDITATVTSLGFPASCNFVLGLLQSYFTTSLATTDTKSKPPSQLTKDNLQTLVDMFILCQPSPFPQPTPITPSLPPLNEVQLLLSIHGQLEDQQSMELHYCIFDAIFGGIKLKEDSPPDGKFDILKKLVSFAISTECPNLLACASLWMKSHSAESAALVKALYHEFCVLLPNAHGPLLQVPTTSPHFAQQLALVFTSLYPFHCVGNQRASVDPSQAIPPIKMLQIVSHWLANCPALLSPPSLLSKELSDLPLVHSHDSDFHSKFPDLKPTLQSLLPGLMQWCVLAPLCLEEKGPKNSSSLQRDTLNKLDKVSKRASEFVNGVQALSLDAGSLRTGEREHTGDLDMQPLIASLHADLLSGILSLTKPLPCQLSGDDVAMLVANLLKYYTQKKLSVGGELVDKMEECVERLAQLLQISLSSGLLMLGADDVSSLASTLPKNKLLQLVIAHARQKT